VGAVSIKWGKQELSDLEIDTTQPPMVFKTQIFSLTGVPVERQKIMVKGGMLKDDADWGKLGIKMGQKLMMMGTADAVPVAPTKAVEFVEGSRFPSLTFGQHIGLSRERTREGHLLAGFHLQDGGLQRLYIYRFAFHFAPVRCTLTEQTRSGGWSAGSNSKYNDTGFKPIGRLICQPQREPTKWTQCGCGAAQTCRTWFRSTQTQRR
jgi:hypothetical protein